MADVGDINPLHPIWPPRPAQGERKKKPPPPPDKEEPPVEKDDNEGPPHIDEYA
jgi:hypothetical protein